MDKRDSDKRWDLSALCEGFGSEGFKRDIEALKEAAANVVGKMRGILSDAGLSTAEKLEKAIKEENSWEKLFVVHLYAFLMRSVEANNADASKAADVCDGCEPDFKLARTLFEHYAASVAPDDLRAAIESSPYLKEHEFFINETLLKSSHKLSEKEEFVIAKLFPSGTGAWETLHANLTANHTVPIVIKGEAKKLPLSVVRNMYYDADAELRKTAYEAELAAYEAIERPAAGALNAIKGHVITIAEMRGYKSPLEMTLSDSRMSRETLDALIGAIEEYLPKLRPFLNKKAAMLGHGDGSKGLPFYDIFAPVGKSDMRFTYEEAGDYVVKHMGAFSKNVGAYMRNAIDNNWVDVYPREGKSGGAFCVNVHSIKEDRFLLNFDGAFDDVTTLAHELGHGYHGHRLIEESAENCEYTMPIAETASTFSETVIYQAALKTAMGDDMAAILENSISGSIQTVVDIYSRYLFETAVFEKRVNGSLSVDELKAEMIKAQKKAYGGGLDENYLHPYMWVNKTHYYRSGANFYNFPYAYGQLFGMGLYAQYEKEGAAFADKYDALLSATGKNTLEDIAKIAGIDVTDKGFWLSSLKVVEADIERFLAL